MLLSCDCIRLMAISGPCHWLILLSTLTYTYDCFIYLFFSVWSRRCFFHLFIYFFFIQTLLFRLVPRAETIGSLTTGRLDFGGFNPGNYTVVQARFRVIKILLNLPHLPVIVFMFARHRRVYTYSLALVSRRESFR